VLFHEKPFSGVNGSGKHINWSIGDNTGINYLEPSASPLRNISFLLAVGAVLYGIHKHASQLRIAVADAGNDHRLGAFEAPPAVMSVYLGEYLSAILDDIEGVKKFPEKKVHDISLGIRRLPNVSRDASDRNRTSPIAFTGNKFEFRACGSSHNTATISSVINMMVADGFNEIIERLEKIAGEKEDIKVSALIVLGQILKETKRVRFEGNNYGEEWLKEAEKRGLPDAKNLPQAYEMLCTDSNIAVFEKYNILSKVELESKLEIKLHQYCNEMEIESKVALDIARTLVKPAVYRHMHLLSGAMVRGKESVLHDEYDKFQDSFKILDARIKDLEKSVGKARSIEQLNKRAHFYAVENFEKYKELREIVDELEMEVDSMFWPLPRYQELLFT
jgi:glutamine synthetase